MDEWAPRAIADYLRLAVVVGVTLIAMKLCEVISWPWWLVLSPFWSAGVVLLFLVFSALCWACAASIFRSHK